MNRRRLGSSGVYVTDMCMGTMTMGSDNEEKESIAILDRAYEAGIDFYDTAEVYPVPPDAKWVHRSEEIVGKWLKTKPRDSIILASKVTGPAHVWFVPPVRSCKGALDRRHIRQAIEGSLSRLGTDYLDLYQVHWPDHDFGYDEILEAMSALVREGKVRVTGSSNENAWGVMKSMAVAEKGGHVRYETVQNNYSIINRRFEDELAEICRREGVSCLPYSPLGGGVCSGKYNGGVLPEGARFSSYMKGYGERQKVMARRFVNERSLAMVAELQQLSEEYEMSVCALSLAWSRQNDFTASTIFGATSIAQLEENLGAAELILPDELMRKIDLLSLKHPYPLG